MFQSYSGDNNLPSFLDHDIWKSSCMLSQNVPGTQHVHENYYGLINFGPDWNQYECATELRGDMKKKEIDHLEDHINIVTEQ